MTFIISAATGNAAFQVADTRVTDAKSGKLIDDQTIKMAIVHCVDAKLLMSFTGLASIRGVKTDAWIVEKLHGFKAWEKVFQEITNCIRDELNKALDQDANLTKYGLEIAIIGLGHSPNSVRQPAIACITNIGAPNPVRKNQFMRFSTPHGKFDRYILTPAEDSEPPGIQAFWGVYGCVGPSNLAITGGLKQLKRRLQSLQGQADPRPLLDFLVSLVRLHRQVPRYEGVIGEHCVAAAIRTDFSTVVVSYGQNGKKLLVPNIIRSPL
ncbi:hypothetical protein ACVW1C_008101 [Bradyrhizobium sp. USDA 4011]